MSTPSCPGSGQPVTDGARVIVTRLRHEQKIGRCGGCRRLVLVHDGVAIEHLVATTAKQPEPRRAMVIEEPIVVSHRTLRERLKGRVAS